MGLGSGSGVGGVVCCRASSDTRIWFFWHSGLMPALLVAGLLAFDDTVDVDVVDPLDPVALDDTCRVTSYFLGTIHK